MDKIDFIETVLLKQELEKRLPNCADTLHSKRYLTAINRLDDRILDYMDDILMELNK